MREWVALRRSEPNGGDYRPIAVESRVVNQHGGDSHPVHVICDAFRIADLVADPAGAWGGLRPPV